MSANLFARLDKLEASIGKKDVPYPRIARLIVRDGTEEDFIRQAEEMGLDTRPESRDTLIVRLIVKAPTVPLLVC